MCKLVDGNTFSQVSCDVVNSCDGFDFSGFCITRGNMGGTRATTYFVFGL